MYIDISLTTEPAVFSWWGAAWPPYAALRAKAPMPPTTDVLEQQGTSLLPAVS